MSGGAIATFVYADFTAAFPAFAANPSQATLQIYFNMAGTSWLRNDGTGRVTSVQEQTNLMYMLTAHITQLLAGADGVSGPSPVGRISSATQGSVTVATELTGTANSAWYQQTPYGAMFWEASAAYRSFPRYIRGRSRFGNGIGGRGGGRAF